MFHLCGRLQGVNTLVVALASRAITLLSSLLEELQVEGLLTHAEDEPVSVGSDFSVNSRCSAWKRVKTLMDDLPLLNYLFAQFSTLYKMVRPVLLFWASTCTTCKGCKRKPRYVHVRAGTHINFHDSQWLICRLYCYTLKFILLSYM